MSDSYLWDRSGDTDEEIQQLEEILGSLRYQPRQFHVPAGIRPARQRREVSLLAIAAGIILFAVVLGLWLRSDRTRLVAVPEAIRENSSEQKPTDKLADARDLSLEKSTRAPVVKASLENRGRRDRLSRNLSARNMIQAENKMPPMALTAAEQASKDQLLRVLRLISFKLNVAQRKTQITPSAIRSEHPMG
jgi:hypothetical protein